METILMREDAPLTAEQWHEVDTTVNQMAQQILVGRRILNLYGPLGFGAYTVPLYTYKGDEEGTVRAKMTAQVPLTTLTQEFVITAKDLELSNSGQQPFDTAPVGAAAAKSVFAEDCLILNGNEEGAPGLLTAEGRQTIKLGKWEEEGQALAGISQATAKLVTEGFYGPYAVVMHPTKFAQLQRVYGRRGVLESELVEKQALAGVFTTPVMPEGKVLVMAVQPNYVDLAIGLDLSTAFVETVNLEHRFRIMETLALRIKDAGAICVLE